MKLKIKHKKHLIVYSILIFLQFFVNAVAMRFLPSRIPAHYGFNGEVDRYGSKTELFILPVCSLIFGGIMFFSSKNSSKNETSTKNNEKIVLITGECCLGLFAVLSFYLLYLAFNNVTNVYSPNIEIGNILCFLMGIVMIVLGNIMPKAKRNSIVGFRCSWTLKNDEVWKKSQHFAGVSSVITGIVLVIAAFFVHNISAIFFIVGLDLIQTIICLIYAYMISHNSDENFILKNKKLIKNAFIFTTILLPFALIGTYFTVKETFKSLSYDIVSEVINQVGSERAAIALSMVQPILLTIVCSFFGFVISSKIGLMKPIGFKFRPTIVTILLSLIFALVMVADPLIFGKIIPQVAEYYETPITFVTILYSVLYGGIVEEILLRLFFMSLLALIIKKIFLRKKENYPQTVFIISNIIAALLFAAGHLPATYQLFGEITPLILSRCFLLNGTGGLIFGYLYRKHGIQYAMTAHALCHFISKIILIVIL